MQIIIGVIIVLIGYLASEVFKRKHDKVLAQSIKIEDYDGYIKLSDIKPFVKENDYNELMANDVVEILKGGETFEIEAVDFTNEKMINYTDLKHLLANGLTYYDGHILNESQNEEVDKYFDKTHFIFSISLVIAAATTIAMYLTK